MNRPTRRRLRGLVLGAFALVLVLPASGLARPGQNPSNPPPPPSIGASIPATYFGPMASAINRKLVGPVQELRAGKLNRDFTEITLPLYTGALYTGVPGRFMSRTRGL